MKKVRAQSKVARAMREMWKNDAPAPVGTISKPKPSKSVNVRQIDNGYLICESGTDNDGRYFSRERYSEKDPLK